MNVLNAKVLETLKCPCCSQYMKTPIYVCLSGHSVCNICLKASSCPVCQLSLTDTRNFSLETISAAVVYPCDYEENGCHKYVSMEELDEHHEICDYRFYRCRLDKLCSWRGRRENLRKHYFSNHDSSILIGNECICLWKHDKPTHMVYLMLAFDEMFYVHAKLRNDTFYWAVQYIGRSEDTILYYFEIEIFTDQFHDRKLVFSEICHDDVKDDVNEITDSGFCVAVPLPVLETYMNLEESVFYKIKIRQA